MKGGRRRGEGLRVERGEDDGGQGERSGMKGSAKRGETVVVVWRLWRKDHAHVLISWSR